MQHEQADQRVQLCNAAEEQSVIHCAIHSYVEILLPVVGECECLEERQPGGSNGGHGGYTVLIQSQLTKKNMRWEGGDLWERACVREVRRGGWREGWANQVCQCVVSDFAKSEVYKLFHYLLQVVL